MSRLEHNIQNWPANRMVPGGLPVTAVRGKAKEVFDSLGIPGKQSEDYKYSPANRIFHGGLQLAESAPASDAFRKEFLIPGMDAWIMVFCNGRFQPADSLLNGIPDGVRILPLGDALNEKNGSAEQHFGSMASNYPEALAAMNTMFAREGAFVHIPEGIMLPKPLHIVSVFTSAADVLYFTRHLIVLGKNAKAEIFESFHGNDPSASFTLNSMAEVLVRESAALKYYILQQAGKDCHHVSHLYAGVARNSHFDTNTVTLDGKWIRNNLRIAMQGEGSEIHLNGLTLAAGEQHVDHNTLVDHRFPNGQSFQLYKGVLTGKSTGVFNGKIYVRPDAQKTNAYQSSKNILLSDDASINAKPQLEIYADDVKCSHGSSTGKLDEQALFYFRSRGIGEESARKLLLGAFCEDVLETVRNEALKDHLRLRMEEKLRND
ncbi:MAG: Fe-S cluster assembly protein SufD [Bacteroidia bacterium]|nr:Fe-S cluster assembly protein SufD [Bacteroidia bacterium]